METLTRLMGQMAYWHMPTHLALGLVETFILMKMKTGPKIHQVRIIIIERLIFHF